MSFLAVFTPLSGSEFPFGIISSQLEEFPLTFIVGQGATNSLRFYLSEHIFTSSLFLEDIFMNYKIPGFFLLSQLCKEAVPSLSSGSCAHCPGTSPFMAPASKSQNQAAPQMTGGSTSSHRSPAPLALKEARSGAHSTGVW